MAVNVSTDQIADAMVVQLAAKMVPADGDPITPTLPIRTVQRYDGKEFKREEGFRRGMAGRCPALRVRWTGSRTLRTTMSRKVDRVESAFQVIVATDEHRSKDGRKLVQPLAEAARKHLGAHMFGLAISPMRFQNVAPFIDDEQMLALAVNMTTRHRVDYTIDPGNDTIDELSGQIVNAEVTRSPKPYAPTVEIVGTPGSQLYAWVIAGVDAAGLRTLLSDTVEIDTVPNTLDADNFAHLAWDAVYGCVSYEVHRYGVNGGETNTGLIGVTAETFFNDKGGAVISATPPDPNHFDLNEGFA